jgi:hypothetical protein
MKQIFSFLAVSMILLSSCSSTKKAAQTPDDVYYSPGGGHVGGTAAASAANEGEYYSTAPSDQYVKMRVQDPARWSYFDDYSGYDSYYSPSVSYGMTFGYGYPYSPYGYGMGFGIGYGVGFCDPYIAWDSYYMWNSWYNPYFYNPYYGGGVIVTDPHSPGSTAYSHLRSFNSVAYQNALAKSNTRLYRPGLTRTSYYNSNTYSASPNHFNGNNSSNFRNYSPGNFNNNSSSRGFQPVRSFTPAPSSNSFHPVGGGGGGGGFRPVGRH